MQDKLIELGLVDDADIVLDEAALDLAALDHPGTDLAPYLDRLEQLTRRLDAIGAGVDEPVEQAKLLARVFADEAGFAGDRKTYDDPVNADMIRVIDRRRGLPVSLSILYVAAARRLGWTANLLDVPGHVLVLLGADAAPVIADPFRGGVAVEPERLAALAAAGSAERVGVRHVAAMPNRAVLVRLLLNQAIRAERVGQGRRALNLYARMTVFAPDTGHAWWERARLELMDEDMPAARRSLTAMLEVTREPDLRGRVLETLSRLGAG